MIDVNLINGAGNMSEKLELLNNKFFAKLTDVQKEEVAMLLIATRNEMTDDVFADFDLIETTLNSTIVAYKGYIRNASCIKSSTSYNRNWI